MKKFSSIILSLILFFTTLPLNAQDVVPVISREDLEHYNYVNKTVNKDIKTYHIDNPIAKHKEFMDIVKWKSDKAFDALKGKNSGTYSDKQTAWNMAFFPHIDKEEKYPNSQYFKKPYELYSYALEIYYTNMMEPEAQRIGLKDYREKARKHIGQIIQKRSLDRNFFANTEVTEGKNPMNEAGYLVAYASQINSFYNEVKELKYRKKTCEHPKLYGIEDVSKDVDCQRALALADDYDLSIIQGGALRIGTFAAIASEEVEQCLRNVLMQLQTPFLPFEEVEDFLKYKSDLSYVDSDGSIHTPPESTWQSCGMSKKELIQIIADNSITREQARQSLKKGVGGKILQGLDYISFSYWQDRANRADEFENYIISNFGEEKLEELKEEGNEKEEREIAERMAQSYNAVLSAIATDLIAYGKIFYYHNDTNLVGLNYDNVPINASQKFALTWYKMGTDITQENSPIAKFARGAIMQAGGKARNLQDNLFVKTMYDAKVESNIKTNVTILSMAADFVIDPTVLLAPLALVKDALVARRAIKTANAISDATKLANKALDTTDAIVDATRTTKKLEPVTDLRPKNVQQITGQVSNIPNTPKPLTTPNSVTPAYNVTDAFTDASKGLETAEDLTKAPASTPATTALDPTDLTKKLTGGFDDALAKAGSNPIDDIIKTEQDLLSGVNKVEKKVPTVYQVSNGSGFDGYVKITTPDELGRTKMVQKIFDGEDALRAKHPNIEIEYPHVISEDLSVLPKDVQAQINDQIQIAAKTKSSRTKILTDPNSTKFIMSSVDTGGMNYVDLKMSRMDTDFNDMRGIIMQNLNNQPITKTEWDEITNIIQEMNKKGFHHGDLGPNMFIKRNPTTGKLKVTFIDFELPPGGKYAKDPDIVDSFQNLLSQYGAITNAEPPVKGRSIGFKPQAKSGTSDPAGYIGFNRTPTNSTPQPKSGTSSPKGCIGFNCQPTTISEPEINNAFLTRTNTLNQLSQTQTGRPQRLIQRWMKLDEKFNGTVEVKGIIKGVDDDFVEITKIGGKTVTASVDDFKAWINGLENIPEASISQPEVDGIKGLKEFGFSPSKRKSTTMGFHPQSKTPSGETKPLGYTANVNSGTHTQGNRKAHIGFNSPQTNTNAPTNPAGYIGFNRTPTNSQNNVIDDLTIKRGKGGVQDLRAKGGNTGPQARGPEGPNARNPYDVRNQAGGTPDTPGTPQQDLSDLNRQISNEPPTTLERNEGKMLHRERQQQVNALKDTDLNKALDNRGITDNTERYNGRKRLKAEAQKWNIADGKFAGAVKVETKGNKVIVYKADGSKATETIDDFKYWVNGIPDLNIGITEKERNAIQGLDDVLGVSKGTPTAPHAPTAASTPAPTSNVNQVANATQQTQEAEQLLKGMDNVLKKNYRLSDNIARRANSLNKSLVTGCTDLKSCKQLTEYLADTRELLKSELFELQKAFTQSTGNTNVDAFYKSLLDSSETPKYIKDFLNDTGLRNFVLNNATAPNFGKIADNMLSRSNTDDLARLLKSEVPDNFKSLQQTANADDWKGFISNVQRELEKRLTDFTKLYNNSLDKAAEKAPELIADIRSGKKQLHRTTLRKAVGKQTADDIVDYYHEIEKINEALGNPVNKRGQANIGQAAKRGQKAGETPTAMATKPLSSKQTLTQTDADNLSLERQNRYQNLSYTDRKEAQYWMSLDKQFHGTVNVEFDYHDSFFVTITKADGSTQKVMGSEFYKWLYGSGFRELKLSEKEIDAMGKEIQKFIRFMESDLRKF